MTLEELAQLCKYLSAYKADLEALRRLETKRGTLDYRERTQQISEVESVIALAEFSTEEAKK